mmetsp:Transcript_28200/g.66972  ORF Transcript_28200/g.66972 Transcript_28200/m.66972 type:complete len:246 (+) Transcript_28200:1577-2314(+)
MEASDPRLDIPTPPKSAAPCRVPLMRGTISSAIICRMLRLNWLDCPKRWSLCTTSECRGACLRLPSAAASASSESQGCFRASSAVGRLLMSRERRSFTKSFAASDMPFQQGFVKSSLSVRMERQTSDTAGLLGFLRSSNGSRPESSWWAMTPADQTSDLGHTSDCRTSGAMNHGVPSRPRSFLGMLPLSKNTAIPKSMAFRGESSAESRSIKLPGLISLCSIPFSWHCNTVRRTHCMKRATMSSV